MTEETKNPETEEITFEEAEFTAAHVANYFLWRAWEEDMEITPMKLLKLVYIAYGWNLVINRQKLFEEKIKAWEHGPVVPELYFEFKNYGKKSISKGDYDAEFTYDESTGEMQMGLVPMVGDKDKDKKTLKVLESVWKKYGSWDGLELSNLTHKEGGAWELAYKKGKNTPLEDSEIMKRSIEGIRSFVEEEQRQCR